MTRQESIRILQRILNYQVLHRIKYPETEALEKAIKVLSEMSDDEYEYLTFEINKGE